MDPPNSYMEVNPENPMYHCDLYDAEIIHKIAQAFLPGLASACVDNTTGGLFKSPGSVAVEVRKEMVGYLTQRSETFVAETVNLDGAPEVEVLNHPYDIISNHIDDFAGSKRNFFSKVSTWLLSDRREDRIDDFVQEMEMKGFWLIGRRETVAKTLLRNVDLKNEYHCNTKFNTAQQLSDHIPNCRFRTMICTSEGCNARFCAAHLENHDSVCPFKIISCEQKCPDEIMRRDMDRHCITVCPMKLVNCAFYPVGCQATIPRCNVKEHNSESLPSHLIFILQTIHKDVSKEDLKKRAEQVEKESSLEKLAGARDVRSLTNMVKNIEAKLGPIEITQPAKAEEKLEKEEGSKESPEGNKESAESPTKMNVSLEVGPKAEGFTESSNDKKENTDKVEHSDAKAEGSLDSSAKIEAASESSSDGEEHKKEERKEKHIETEATITKDDDGKREEGIEGLAAKEEPKDSLTNENAKSQPSDEKEESVESPTKKSTDSPVKNEKSNESPPSPESPERTKESSPPSPESPEKTKESRPPSPVSPDKTKESRPPSPVSPEKTKESRPQSPESPDKKEATKESPTKKEGSRESPSSSDNE